MPACKRIARKGVGDLPFAVVVVAVTIGLGIVAAGLSRSTLDLRSGSVSVDPLPGEPLEAPLLPMSPVPGIPRDEAAGRSSVASLVPSARSRAASPHEPSSHSPDDDDPRAFLAHMTAVMHRRGLPLPGASGRLQSLFNVSTPAASNAGLTGRLLQPGTDSRARVEDLVMSSALSPCTPTRTSSPGVMFRIGGVIEAAAVRPPRSTTGANRCAGQYVADDVDGESH